MIDKTFKTFGARLSAEKALTIAYAFVLALGFFLWGTELFLVLRPSDLASLHAGSPDEALFLDTVTTNYIFHFSSGNGPLFWGLLVYFRDMAPKGFEIAIIRVAFVSLKYIAFYMGAAALGRVWGRASAALFLFVSLSVPGYFFFGKIISPEYLLLFTMSATICLAALDGGLLGWMYRAALVCAFLSVMAKVSMLPFALCFPGYGVAQAFLNAPSHQVKRAVKEAGLAFLLYAALTGLVFFLCPLDTSLQQIRDIMAIVPPLKFSMENVLLAWRRDEVTWDQIAVAGLRVDFLPAAAAMFWSLVFGVGAIARRDKTPRILLGGVLFVAAALMAVNSVFHSMALSWYLFGPCFLFIAACALLLPPRMPVVTLATFLVFVLVFAFSGAPHLIKHAAFKQGTDRQLIENAEKMKAITAFLAQNYPCAQTGLLDILVPTDAENAKNPSTARIMPARLGLMRIVQNHSVYPDFLVVNRGVVEGRSPLIQYIIKDALAQYDKLQSWGALDLYLQKPLLIPGACHASAVGP